MLCGGAAQRGGPMERIKNVLFDLDGTLTDPAEGITNALMHAQRRLGRPVSRREELYVFIGPPLIEMFMSEWGLSRAEAEQALIYSQLLIFVFISICMQHRIVQISPSSIRSKQVHVYP